MQLSSSPPPTTSAMVGWRRVKYWILTLIRPQQQHFKPLSHTHSHFFSQPFEPLPLLGAISSWVQLPTTVGLQTGTMNLSDVTNRKGGQIDSRQQCELAWCRRKTACVVKKIPHVKHCRVMLLNKEKVHYCSLKSWHLVVVFLVCLFCFHLHHIFRTKISFVKNHGRHLCRLAKIFYQWFWPVKIASCSNSTWCWQCVGVV